MADPQAIEESLVEEPQQVIKASGEAVIPKDVQELFNDLDEKWSHDKLTQKFRERIRDHMRVNPTTRLNMLVGLDKMSKEFKDKAAAAKAEIAN